jgi:hypothetical protein
MNQNSKIEVRVVINYQNKEQSECNKEGRRLFDFDFEDRFGLDFGGSKQQQQQQQVMLTSLF